MARNQRDSGSSTWFRQVAEVAVARVGDAWENYLTGLGASGDKMSNHLPKAGHELTWAQRDHLYHHDAMARLATDEVVDAAFSRGYGFTFDGEIDDFEVWKQRMRAEHKRLHAKNRLADALAFGRLDGRAALLIGAFDGQPMEEPLDLNRVQRVDYLEVLEHDQLVCMRLGDDPRSEYYGQPEIWSVTRDTGRSVHVHASRLIITGGPRTKRMKWQSRGYADMSVLDAAYEALRAFDSAFRTVDTMLSDSSQMVLGIKGFFDVLGSKDAESFRERMSLISLGRSVSNILPIDSEDESATMLERSFSGVEGIMNKVQQRLAGALRTPETILAGRSPAGLNATGESDAAFWYDQVEAFQRNDAQEPAERIAEIVAASIGAPDPISWGVEFPKLWQMSPDELASTRKTVADTDIAYINAGVLTPEEVAMARFGGGEWSLEAPQIDMAMREEMLALAVGAEKSRLEPSEGESMVAQKMKPMEAVDPATALNGAQVKSMMEIVTAVAMGLLPRETGVQLLEKAFPISAQEADDVMGPVGRTFFNKPDSPAE